MEGVGPEGDEMDLPDARRASRLSPQLSGKTGAMPSGWLGTGGERRAQIGDKATAQTPPFLHVLAGKVMSARTALGAAQTAMSNERAAQHVVPQPWHDSSRALQMSLPKH